MWNVRTEPASWGKNYLTGWHDNTHQHATHESLSLVVGLGVRFMSRRCLFQTQLLGRRRSPFGWQQLATTKALSLLNLDSTATDVGHSTARFEWSRGSQDWDLLTCKTMRDPSDPSWAGRLGKSARGRCAAQQRSWRGSWTFLCRG